MAVASIIHILCEGNSSPGTAIVNGLLAWAAFLGGSTAFWSGLPAAVALLIPSKPESLSRRINHGLGVGLVAGMGGGLLLFFVFIARIAA
jgi:hypothetical protein